VADGVDGEGALAVHAALAAAGAVPRIVAARLGPVESFTDTALDPDATLETMPSCLFDAMVVADGDASVDALCELGHALEFVKDQYRHCKAILALGAGQELLEEAGLPMGDQDPAIVVVPSANRKQGLADFIAAVGAHRNWDRAMDPPIV
jgi:catalase